MTMRFFTIVALGSVLAGPVLAQTTFSHDVAPILYKHCAACHHANDIAPMPLITYNDARPWAAAIKEAVLTRKMPPWKADPHFGKWSNDSSLTDAEIATIREWVDSGRPEGNPKDLPPAPHFADGWDIGKPDAIVTIPQQKIEAAGTDQYVYLTVPSGFTEDKWVVAAELRAGNRKVVHHAHVFVVDPDAKPKTAGAANLNPTEAYAKSLMVKEGSLQWIRPDAPVIDDGCAVDDNGLIPGHKSNDLGNLIASYLPGREPDVYPPGTARLIKAGSSLNFQIHYHRTGKPEVDETSVGFIFAKEPPKKIARRIDLSNQMFRIPAGASEQQVSECHTFNKDIYITSLTPHMHLRGKAMEMVVTYPDGRRETLLSVPHYDFNWQITYRAAKPIFIPKGTRIAVIGHFDNSQNNPTNPDPTKPVRWGAASETEMMDGWIEYEDAASPPPSLPASETRASVK
jgi:cytochrome c553